jgi:hypothetical protein
MLVVTIFRDEIAWKTGIWISGMTFVKVEARLLSRLVGVKAVEDRFHFTRGKVVLGTGETTRAARTTINTSARTASGAARMVSQRTPVTRAYDNVGIAKSWFHRYLVRKACCRV